MSNQTIATNLQRLRKDRGFNQAQLAETAALSISAYRKLEKGTAAPTTETLKALSDALGIRLKELLASAETLNKVRFRSLKRLKNRDQLLVDVARWLRDFTDLEDLTNEKHGHNLDPLWIEIGGMKDKDIPHIAALTRKHFKLSEREPVHDICGLLESQGIKVYSKQVANDAFLGLSVSEEDGGPAVIVNTWEGFPVETWIFSAAHEFGHLLLHLGAYDVTQEDEDDEQEKEANQFASCFLMPEAVFLKEWEEAAGLPLVDRVLKVKRVFRVSWRAVLYRIAERLPEEQRYFVWKLFNEQYKRRMGRSLLKHDEPQSITQKVYKGPHGVRSMGDEPAGMASYDFREDRLSLLVRKAVDREIISLSRGAEILRLPLEQMRELLASWVA